MRASSQVARTDLTLKFYDEWQSEAMVRARITSNVILREALTGDDPLSFTRLCDNLLGSDRFEEWVAVSSVIHFFEKLSVALQEGQLKVDLFWRLFGRYVVYWREATLDALADVSRHVDTAAEAGWAAEIARLEQ